MFLRVLRVFLGASVLGAGVAGMLNSRHGADGFGMLLDGVSIKLDWDYALSTILVASLVTGWAVIRGIKPGIGTIVMPVTVGVSSSIVQKLLPEPELLTPRIAMFVIGFCLVALGVAYCLTVDVGVGPLEALALSFDPPIPFRWAYSSIQIVFGLVGWWWGADIGLGSLAAITLLGPIAGLIVPWFGGLPQRRPAPARSGPLGG